MKLAAAILAVVIWGALLVFSAALLCAAPVEVAWSHGNVTTGGTGVYVENDGRNQWIVTAAHVLRGATSKPRVRVFGTQNWHRAPLALVNGKALYDSRTDVAVLFTTTIPASVQPTPLAETEPPAGVEIYRWGLRTSGRGLLLPRRWMMGGECLLSHTATPVQGDSGGPVVYQGQVIGLTCFGGNAGSGPGVGPIRRLMRRIVRRPQTTIQHTWIRGVAHQAPAGST